jgi:hypothetical protein
MKILIPVSPAKRLPPVIDDPDNHLSAIVFVKYTNKSIAEDYSSETLACYDYQSEEWVDAFPLANTFDNPRNEIVCWYDEVVLEDYFPKDFGGEPQEYLAQLIKNLKEVI